MRSEWKFGLYAFFFPFYETLRSITYPHPGMLCPSRLVAVGRVQALDLLLFAPFPPIYQRHQSVDVLSSVLGRISAHQVVGQLFYANFALRVPSISVLRYR